ncbi:MAG: SRPBCC family protein [Planctomycetaceae bacterium]|nr:SRPBCC family protein [Planctomycetaceae bacterium]
MQSLSTSIVIEAPPEEVFSKGSDLEHCEEWISGILKAEVLTEGPIGVGTRWKETRMMFGKEAEETMEIVEFETPHYYVASAYNCGTHYRTKISFEPAENGTEVTSTFTGTPDTFMGRILNWLFGWMAKGTVLKMMRQDLEDLKRAIEG